MSDIRKVLGVEPRVETGAVRFGDDWPGVFIRGDNAFGLVVDLLGAGPFRDLAISRLLSLLASCDLSGFSAEHVASRHTPPQPDAAPGSAAAQSDGAGG